MSGIEVFTPATKVLTINGTKVEVGPLKARRFAALQVALGPVWEDLRTGNSVGLLGARFEATRAAVVAGTDQSSAWVDEQDPDDVLDLLGAILEVNHDFLFRRLGPAKERMAASLSRMVQAAGASSSRG